MNVLFLQLLSLLRLSKIAFTRSPAATMTLSLQVKWENILIPAPNFRHDRHTFSLAPYVRKDKMLFDAPRQVLPARPEASLFVFHYPKGSIRHAVIDGNGTAQSPTKIYASTCLRGYNISVLYRCPDSKDTYTSY